MINLKFKVRTIIQGFLIFLIFLNTGLTQVFDIGLLSSTHNIHIITAVSSLLLFFFCISSPQISKTLRQYTSFLNLYVILLFIVLFAGFFYTALTYQTTFLEIAYASMKYLNVLLAYPILYIFASNKDIKPFLKKVMVLTIIALAIRGFAAVIYNRTGNVLLPLIMEVGGLWVRNDRVRMNDTCIGGIMVILSFYFYLFQTSYKKMFYLILTAGIVIYVAFVFSARAQLISVLAALTFMYIFKKRRTSKQFVVCVMICTILVSLFFTNYTQNFISSFLPSDNEFGASTSIRLASVAYYSQMVKQNIFFGLGFLWSGNPQLYQILRGWSGTAYIEDLGVIGIFFNLGICGLLLFIVMFIRFIKITISRYKLDMSNSKVLLVGIISFIVVSSVSLSVFNDDRIFSLPFYWAIFEYLNRSIVFEYNKSVSNQKEL